MLFGMEILSSAFCEKSVDENGNTLVWLSLEPLSIFIEEIQYYNIPLQGSYREPPLPATPTSISFSDEDSTESSFTFNNYDSTRGEDMADMLYTEPHETPQPASAPTPDERIPFKLISTTASIIIKPTPSNFPRMPALQETVPVSINEKDSSLATSAVYEHDILDNDDYADEIMENSHQFESDVNTDDDEIMDDSHQFDLTTFLSKSVSPSISPVETDAGHDDADPTSFILIIGLAVLLYSVGVLFGCFLHWCYRRNQSKNFADSKIWRDNDGLGSFNIAGELRIKMFYIRRPVDSSEL